MRMKTRFAGAFPRESARSNRFVARDLAEVALAISSGKYGNDRRQGELLFQVAQFILQLPERHVADFGFGNFGSRRVQVEVHVNIGNEVIPTCDPFNVTLRASNKCKTSGFCYRVRLELAARRAQGCFHVCPFSSLKIITPLQIAAVIFFPRKKYNPGKSTDEPAFRQIGRSPIRNAR